MKRGIKTKNGKYHTRFSIKSILQNPVYVIADDEVYNYLVNKEADIFSDKAAFDGVHGLMVYNRTDQEKGRATRYLSPEEWIVSVGEHPGIIPGREWIRIQESLQRNKSKAYRKPRGNEALLTGLLFCRCGSRMYPKLSKRKTADGKRIYTYVCKMKDRSKHKLCNERNANGNTLDLAIIEQIKVMEDNQGTFIAQLEQSRKFYTGNRTDYEDRLAAARRDKAEAEKKAAAPAEENGVDFTHEEEIDFDTFCKVELRVAEVRACENLKESKKLLHLTVFDGERERCILSGIAKWFKPEDLIGKKIGIVCNLAPRPMLKGKYVSEGMIFAADTADGGCSIAFYGDNTPVGSRIH